MVTSPLYKSYSREIAKLFCSDQTNKILCEGSIIERLNTFLDDYTYPVFISKINSGRSYITSLEQFQDRGFRIVLIDLISGERVTAWMEIPYNYPYLSKLPGKLLSHQYNIISANKTFNEQNKSDVRITWNPVKPAYGITFIPGSLTPPGSDPIIPGGSVPGGTITKTPGQTQMQTPVNNQFNFSEMFSNPIVLVGAGLLFFFLMKK